MLGNIQQTLTEYSISNDGGLESIRYFYIFFSPNTMFSFTFSCCIIYLNFNLKLRVELLLALHYWLLDWKNKETTHTLTLWQSWIIFFFCLDDHYKLPLCISAPLKNITIASSQKFDHRPSRNIFGVRDHLMHQHNSYKFDHCLYYLGYLWYFRKS